MDAKEHPGWIVGERAECLAVFRSRVEDMIIEVQPQTERERRDCVVELQEAKHSLLLAASVSPAQI
eukprot:11190484-Lingulodinium_polyedra.AAC.1